MLRVWHTSIAYGHQHDHLVYSPDPIAAVRRHAQHDCRTIEQVPVSAASSVRERLRHRHVHRGYRVEVGHYPEHRTSEVSRHVLPVYRGLHDARGAH